MKNMGTPMKIVLGLVVVLILIGLFWLMVGFNMWAMLFLIGGVVVVLIIFMMFLGFLKLLQKRKSVYLNAQTKHPERWSGNIRNWNKIKEVFLNPDKQKSESKEEKAA